MLKSKRQQEILQLIYKTGYVKVNDLSTLFKISKDTIRRDLSELEEQGVIKRSYGGAVPFKRLPDSYNIRINRHKDEKYKIAKKALEYIKPNTLIAIDGGSTNTILASLIPLSMPLTVVTNSFSVELALHKHPHIKVIFLGGEYNETLNTTTGEFTLTQIQDYYFDSCFIGMYAIDSKRGLTIPDRMGKDMAIKEYMIQHSKEVNILAGTRKLDQVSHYVVGQIEDITRIVCEKKVDQETEKAYLHKIVY